MQYPSRQQIEQHIRQSARARGVDPDVAVRVAASEGLNADPREAWQSNIVNNGQRERSYGPYQLYIDGGLGNEFMDRTGLDPRNPDTWKQQVDFSLDHASNNGWGAWYGADRVGIGDRQGIGGAPTMSTRGQTPMRQPTQRPQPQQQPQGQPQEQKPDGILARMFPNAKPGAMDQIALSLMSMSSYPTPGMEMMMGGIQDRMKDRRETQKTEGQRNKTLERLQQLAAGGNPQAQRAIEFLQSGGAIGDALKMAFAKQERDKGVNIDGQLVNPYTAEVMGDFRDGGDMSAREQKIQRGMDVLGMSREEATKHADGMIEIIPNPDSGDAMLYDKVTRQTRRIEMPERAGASGTIEAGDVGNVEGAIGGRGIVNSIANAVSDAAGFDLPAEAAAQAESALTNLSTRTMLSLSGDWAGRPSNLTRERIEALTVKPNQLFTGRGKAKIRFQDMKQLIDQSIQSAEAVVNGDYSPAQRQQAQQKIQTLKPLSQEYGAILQQLEGSDGGSEIDSIADKWDN